jgi:hypothetical protein
LIISSNDEISFLTLWFGFYLRVNRTAKIKENTNVQNVLPRIPALCFNNHPNHKVKRHASQRKNIEDTTYQDSNIEDTTYKDSNYMYRPPTYYARHLSIEITVLDFL